MDRAANSWLRALPCSTLAFTKAAFKGRKAAGGVQPLSMSVRLFEIAQEHSSSTDVRLSGQNTGLEHNEKVKIVI